MTRFLIFFLVLAASTASAQTFSTPTRLLALDSGKVELAPRIHSKGSVVYASWIDEKQSKNGDIAFATSTDGGHTFSTPVRVTSTGKVSGSLQAGGEFAVDDKGYIHMVWTEQRAGNEYDVFYSRSTDNGLSWSEVSDVSRDEGNVMQDYPTVAADSLGSVYVAWIDNREIVAGLNEYDHIYFCRSLDNGATWEAPIKADRHANDEGGSCECCRVSMEASPDGKVFIGFRGNVSHVRDIWVARSNDKGMTWDQTIKVQTKEWILHSCPVSGPKMTLDKAGNLHVVYRMVDAGKTYVFYNILPNGASKTFTQFALTPAATVNYPDVMTTGNGVVYAAYQAGSDGIQYRRTTDGGTTWEAMQWIDDGKSMQEFAVFTTIGDSLALVWQDNARDKGEIMIARVLDITHGVLPQLNDLTRQIESDSVTVTWTDAVAGGMTWYEVVTEDSTMIVLDKSLKISRELADRSNVSVTPINSVGRGESMSLLQLSVATQSEHALSVYPNPVSSGGVVVLPVASEKSLEWNIVDVSGRVISGTHRSNRIHTSHELVLPQLPDGMYYLTNNYGTYTIVVRSK